MTNPISVRDLLVDEFTRSFASSRGKGMSGIAANAVATHPLLIDALHAVEGACTVDDASEALSKHGDKLQERAAANRASPEWPDLCVAMGAVRTTAAAVWRN